MYIHTYILHCLVAKCLYLSWCQFLPQFCIRIRSRVLVYCQCRVESLMTRMFLLDRLKCLNMFDQTTQTQTMDMEANNETQNLNETLLHKLKKRSYQNTGSRMKKIVYFCLLVLIIFSAFFTVLFLR